MVWWQVEGPSRPCPPGTHSPPLGNVSREPLTSLSTAAGFSLPASCQGAGGALMGLPGC